MKKSILKLIKAVFWFAVCAAILYYGENATQEWYMSKLGNMENTELFALRFECTSRLLLLILAGVATFLLGLSCTYKAASMAHRELTRKRDIRAGRRIR